MTAQARSRDLDAYNLVLLMDHLGKSVDLRPHCSSSVSTGMLSEDLITHPMHDDQEVNSCWFD